MAELLFSDRSDPKRVRVVADRVGWPLPRRAAVVQINRDHETSRTLLERLDGSCLRLRRGQVLLGVVPDPDGPGRRARLATVLRGAAAVVGASVPLDRLPASVELVGLAAGLRHPLLHKRRLLTVEVWWRYATGCWCCTVRVLACASHSAMLTPNTSA